MTITFTSPWTKVPGKTRRAARAGALLLLFVAPRVAPAAERDVFVSGLVLYAKLAPDSAEAKEHGKYPRLVRWDKHGGLAPDKIDVVGVVNGRDVEVRVVLEVFPSWG